MKSTDQVVLQADRLGAAPTFDAPAKIGDLHTEALSLQVCSDPTHMS